MASGQTNGGGSGAVDWSQAMPIEISLTSFDYAPDALRLHAGTPYRLHLTNKSTGGHNLHSPEFFAAVTVAPEDLSKIADGSVEVDGDQSVDLRIIPMKPGRYPFHCSHFMHAIFGMSGSVVIE